jgi:hypothetical protein
MGMGRSKLLQSLLDLGLNYQDISSMVNCQSLSELKRGAFIKALIDDNQEAAQAEKRFEETLNMSAIKDKGKAVKAVARLRKERR